MEFNTLMNIPFWRGLCIALLVIVFVFGLPLGYVIMDHFERVYGDKDNDKYDEGIWLGFSFICVSILLTIGLVTLLLL